MAQAEVDISLSMEGRLAPLPTAKDLASRRSSGATGENSNNHNNNHNNNTKSCCYESRRTSTLSLKSFTSDNSVGSSSDPAKIVEVGNLRFLNDNDMPDGQSSILGRGAFAMVRLARRHKVERNSSVISALSCSSTAQHDDNNIVVDPVVANNGKHSAMSPPPPPPPPIPKSISKEYEVVDESKGGGETTGRQQHYKDDYNNNNINNNTIKEDEKGEGVLVAVKIFEKSLLEKCRTISRNSSNNQMQVTTALENVEREIAVMKMIQHPNLVSLYEVIDTGSNRLYMVLEYVPLGEIMTNVPGTGMYKRRPIRTTNNKGEETTQQQQLNYYYGVNNDGYFDEHHAALYFVDIMQGLAHLHKNHIVHRDLKPENILLDSRGFAKISDFGVAHLFEDEMNTVGRASLTSRDNDGSHHDAAGDLIPSARISRSESDAALKMKSMSDMGKLTKTEGTWCFWSPEMCAENSLVFSGYACDIWAAGVCLYIFATGKLPFYTEIPLLLFDKIAQANVKFDNLDVTLSNDLIDMLKKVLNKDPSKRAGVGDCLQHPYCKHAREQRMKELGEQVETHEEVVVQSEDLRKAFSSTHGGGGPLRKLAGGLSKRFVSLRNQLTHSQKSTSQMSISVNDMSSSASHNDNNNKKNFRRQSSPFAFWRSQKTMSMDDNSGEGESNSYPRRRWGTLPSSLWKSTGNLR